MTAPALPHDPYIGAVAEALAAAGRDPVDYWTSDADTRGTYCYLNAVITLDPSGTHDTPREDIPADAPWPEGLLLIWEWHTGREAEDGEPERGPNWLFAEKNEDASNEYPTDLPVHGYASPAAVIEAARLVVERRIKPGHFHNFGQPGWDGGTIGGSWEHADELESAVTAWDAQE